MHLAVLTQNIEIIKLLLQVPGIDASMKDIISINENHEIINNYSNGFIIHIYEKSQSITPIMRKSLNY